MPAKTRASRKVTQAPTHLTPKHTTSKSTTEEPSLGDKLTQRDSLYYNVPLILLVSYAKTLSDIPNIWPQVEVTLFKVPRSYFESSNVFWETYLLGLPDDEISQGVTDQQPLRLDGVDMTEFRCLLKAMM